MLNIQLFLTKKCCYYEIFNKKPLLVYLFTCLLVYACFWYSSLPLHAQQNPTVDRFIGVNWQISSSPEGIECAGFVREFSRWVDTQAEGNNPNVAADLLFPDECLDLNPAASGNPA